MNQPTEKLCRKCNIVKPIVDFGRRNDRPCGVKSQCKACGREYQKIRNKENPTYIQEYRQRKKDEITAYSRKYYNANKDKINASSIKWMRSEQGKEYQRKYSAENRKERTQKELKRRQNNPYLRLKHNLRHRVWKVLKGLSKADTTMELLGCSVGDIKTHIELQFLPGMTWDNYGEWHVDHIRPCASFDLSDPEQQRECFNWKNLQPLWAEDNRAKRDIWQNEGRPNNP